MTAYAWGSGASGQLGDNTLGAGAGGRSSPVVVVGSHSFVQLAAAGTTSAGLKANGEVWTWGNGRVGALGNNTAAVSVSSPVLVVGSHSFVEVRMGATNETDNPASVLARKANGEVWSWGNNGLGELADNTLTNRSSPVLVVGAHSFIAIAIGQGTQVGGQTTGIALKADGSAWAWGFNQNGSVGDNTTTLRQSPTAVIGAHSFIAIGAGTRFAAGLKANGEIWTWGLNNVGQLGDGTVTQRLSPVLVVGAHSFIALAVGAVKAYGLKANGEAWGWGDGTTNSLGDNTLANQSSPVLVIGGHSFTALVAGGLSVTALKANGEAWSWGFNNVGQLGHQDLINRSSPVLVVGGFVFSTLATGENHTLAVATDVVAATFPPTADMRGGFQRGMRGGFLN